MTPREMLDYLVEEAQTARNRLWTTADVNPTYILAIAAWVDDLEHYLRSVVSQCGSHQIGENRALNELAKAEAHAKRLQHQVDTLTGYLRVLVKKSENEICKDDFAYDRLVAFAADALVAIEEDPKG